MFGPVLLTLLLSYLLGSVLFGVLYSRLRGADIRHADHPGGSGTLRQYGVGAGVAVTLLDFAKGVVAVLLARFLAQGHGLPPHSLDWLAALAVVAGHCYPLYFRFDGGAGLATFVGALLVASPLAAWVLFLLALLLVPLYRRFLQARVGLNVIPALSIAVLPLGLVVTALLGGLPTFAAGGAVMAARGLQTLRRGAA